MSADNIRTLNAVLAGIAALMFAWEVRCIWPNATPPRRLRYISIELFAITIAYGSLESEFWPQYQFRVLLGFIAAASMVIAGIWAHRTNK